MCEYLYKQTTNIHTKWDGAVKNYGGTIKRTNQTAIYDTVHLNVLQKNAPSKNSCGKGQCGEGSIHKKNNQAGGCIDRWQGNGPDGKKWGINCVKTSDDACQTIDKDWPS